MSLVVGTNSWCSVSEADTYLEYRINASEWFQTGEKSSPGEVSRESLLVSAFYWLQGAPELEISATVTDTDVKNAQIEAALFLLEHYDELNERRAAIYTGVSSFKLSKKSENFDINQLQIPSYILGMLGNYAIMNTIALLEGEYDV
jgi:hypothetical protein